MSLLERRQLENNLKQIIKLKDMAVSEAHLLVSMLLFYLLLLNDSRRSFMRRIQTFFHCRLPPTATIVVLLSAIFLATHPIVKMPMTRTSIRRTQCLRRDLAYHVKLNVMVAAE